MQETAGFYKEKLILPVLHNKEELKEKFLEYFPYDTGVDELIEDIEEKLGESFFKNIKRFIFEYPYVEKEWREIYSLHYCKTNYTKATPFVFRVHLVNKNIESIDELEGGRWEPYLGYITIRPIPTSFISKIVIKPSREFYEIKDSEKLFMITTKQKVHIGNVEIEFPAFPFFSQDSMVTVCAHADVLMIANIMHNRYGLDEISVEKLISGITPSYSGRKIPSEGINMEQLAYCLQKNNWYVRIKGFTNSDLYLFSWDDVPENNKELIQSLNNVLNVEQVENAEINKSDDKKTITVTTGKNSLRFKINEEEDQIILTINGEEKYGYPLILKKDKGKLKIYAGNTAYNFEEIIKHIDAYIESGIPCILAFEEHVVVIGGHTINENKERDYIFFDDSGAHFVGTFGKPPKFSTNISTKKLREKIMNVTTPIFLLCPEFERVHFPLKSVNTMMGKLAIVVNQLGENEIAKIFMNKKHRIILMDVKELKKFFLKNNINTFNNCNFPHYVWCVELYRAKRGNPDNLIGYVFFDASAHQYDYNYSCIRDCNGHLVIEPKGVGKDRIISLLEKF